MNEDVYRMLAEHSSDVISRHTPEGEYLYVSPSSKRVMGFTPDELIGVNVFGLFHPDDITMIREANQTKLDTGEAETSRYRIQTKDGSYKWVETISKIIRDEHGEPVEIHAFTRDVSQQKENEEALEATIQEKNVLLQEIHHRVKNNLAIVSGLLTMQKQRVDLPEFEKVANDCEMRIKSIALVHEMLYNASSLSKLDLGAFIRELFESSQKIFDRNRQVVLYLDCASVTISVNQAIPVALIMNELITNSYKYAFQNGRAGKMEVTLTEQDDIITIAFRDNGGGLTSGFDYRNASSMGFTIIRTLIDQLNADLQISSDQGFTARFTFEKVTRELESNSNQTGIMV